MVGRENRVEIEGKVIVDAAAVDIFKVTGFSFFFIT